MAHHGYSASVYSTLLVHVQLFGTQAFFPWRLPSTNSLHLYRQGVRNSPHAVYCYRGLKDVLNIKCCSKQDVPTCHGPSSPPNSITVGMLDCVPPLMREACSYKYILEENPKTPTKQILVAGIKHAPRLLLSLYFNIKTHKCFCSSVANFIQVSISWVSHRNLQILSVSSAYPKALEMLSV